MIEEIRKAIIDTQNEYERLSREGDVRSATDRNQAASKLMFLDEIGLSADNIPQSFLEENAAYQGSVPEMERRFISTYAKPFITKFCIKDVCGTRHPNYKGMPFVCSFLHLKRASELLSQYKENPDYYETTLKDEDTFRIDAGSAQDIFRLYRISNGKCFTNWGNHRITFLKMRYMHEMAQAQTEEEKKAVEEKNTFYAVVQAEPKNKAIVYYIMFLDETYGKQIKIEFKGNDPDECRYEINLNNETILIENEKQLRDLVSMEFNYSNCQNMHEVCKKLVIQYNTTYIRNRVIYDEFNPNFEETITKANILYQIHSSNRKDLCNLDELKIDNLDSQNIDEVLTKMVNEIREKQINYLKNEAFTRIESIEDIERSIELIEQNGTINYLLDINKEDLFSNYGTLIEYFKKYKHEIPEIVFTSSNNYEDFSFNFFNYIYNQKLEAVEDTLSQKQTLEQAIDEKNRIIKLQTHNEEYWEAKRKDSSFSEELELADSELTDYETKLQTYIDLKTKLEQQLNKYENSNIFKRLIHTNQIKEIKVKIEQCEQTIEKLNKSITTLREKIESIEVKRTQNIEEFQEKCGEEIDLKQYEELIQDVNVYQLEEEIEEIKTQIDALNIEEQAAELKRVTEIFEAIKANRLKTEEDLPQNDIAEKNEGERHR